MSKKNYFLSVRVLLIRYPIENKALTKLKSFVTTYLWKFKRSKYQSMHQTHYF